MRFFAGWFWKIAQIGPIMISGSLTKAGPGIKLRWRWNKKR